MLELKPPRGAGVAASALLLLGSASFGVVYGGHTRALTDELKDLRDSAANAFGLRLKEISLAGQGQVSREEILDAIGITARSSLLFLDAALAREVLKTNPWIAEATVLKLYPGRLHIAINERDAFALWQKDRKIYVISQDGIVLEPYTDGQFASLPLVVGVGAERKARDFMALMAKYPVLRSQVHASVLVAERRWNLKLKNGVEVKLPETDIESAIDALVKLDREKQILTRDITTIDLRLADRITVRLSDEAAQVREDAVRERERERDKAKTAKRKGGNA